MYKLISPPAVLRAAEQQTRENKLPAADKYRH